MKKTEAIILGLILIVAALLRFPLIAQGFFAFTYDQGRDLLAVKDIVNNFNLTLIGPTTGLPGIFYGPWWYYFLAPIFWLSSGDPLKATVAFAIIGLVTIILIFLLLRKITGSSNVALLAAALAAMSQPFITSSSQIWSPSLVLFLMIIYIYSLHMIFESKPMWFLALGISVALIADSGAAFGVVLSLATVVSSLIFRKHFFQKHFVLFFVGLFIVLAPRILFDFRNEFLITKSVLNWLSEPKVYQEKLSLLERLINRADLIWLQFAQTFTQSRKLVALVPLSIFFALSTLYINTLRKIKLFNFLIIVTALVYIIFSLYPDAVWDYYLVGMPMIFLTLGGLIANVLPQNKVHLFLSLAIILIVFNFNSKLTDPFSITWQGDGAIYKNQKNVLDQLQKELHGDFSLYIYSPARFDYPFDYLVDDFILNGKIDPPKDNQKRFYLIIRDDQTHTYITNGWYGDKVRNMPTLRQKKEYPGLLIVEKHETR